MKVSVYSLLVVASVPCQNTTSTGPFGSSASHFARMSPPAAAAGLAAGASVGFAAAGAVVAAGGAAGAAGALVAAGAAGFGASVGFASTGFAGAVGAGGALGAQAAASSATADVPARVSRERRLILMRASPSDAISQASWR